MLVGNSLYIWLPLIIIYLPNGSKECSILKNDDWDRVTNLLQVSKSSHSNIGSYEPEQGAEQIREELIGHTTAHMFRTPIPEHSAETFFDGQKRSQRNININILNNFPWADILRANGVVEPARRSLHKIQRHHLSCCE